jgi:predicted transcriptional regulator YheO
VVKDLDASGSFLVQRSVGYVPDALKVSRYSACNYLRAINGPDAGAGSARRDT